MDLEVPCSIQGGGTIHINELAGPSRFVISFDELECDSYSVTFGFGHLRRRTMGDDKGGLTLSHAAGELLMRLFGPGASEAGEMIGNEFRAFKVRRLHKLAEKTLEALAARNLSPDNAKPLPTGISIRVIDHASKEDDDEVLDMWAKLVASGVDPEGDPIDKIFVGILSEIGACEVQVLRFLWLRVKTGDLAANLITEEEVGAFADEYLRKYPIRQRVVAIQNLIRQRCVKIALSQYYLDKIGFEGTSFTISTDGGDSLSELKDALNAAKQVIKDLSGENDWQHLGLHAENEDWTPEMSFALTELGAELMRRCEPT